MKILYICGSIEPGKDGVGDYTRRLCGKLISMGHQGQIVSLCDYHAARFGNEIQFAEGNSMLIHRVPISENNKQRLNWVQDIISDFQPDWISLQFVPYSFNPRGLPFWLPSFIQKLKGIHSWHVMFHELWIGMDLDATFKSKIIGFLQIKLVSNILIKNRNITVNTQTDLYQNKIQALGFNAQILPLFSNIKKKANVEIVSDELEVRFCIFGSIHYGAPVEQFITDLRFVLLEANDNRRVKFIFIGHSGTAIDEWKKILVVNKIDYDVTGFISEDEISKLMLSSHFGISTTPYILSQKSGSVAAMLDHHIPVLCVARNWKVKGFNQSLLLNVINYEKKENIKDFMNKKFTHSNENNIENVTSKFIDGLK